MLDKAVVKLSIKGRESGVLGPHPLEFLAHRQQDVRYPTRCNAFTAGSNPSLSIACGKHLEEGDGIVKSPEERIDPEFLAKFDPNFPMGILCLGSFSGDAIDDGFLDKDKIIVENISEVRLQALHNLFCGKLRLKWASNWESVRCQAREQKLAMTLAGPGT